MDYKTKVKWIYPKHCNPPHRVTHPEKLRDLYEQFNLKGWDITKPPLLGYSDKKIQLISGSHRHAAAKLADIRIPVIIYPMKRILKIWGTEEWLHVLSSANSIKYKGAR